MPRKAVEGAKRLRSLNLKTTDELRALLESAASASGRTLTAEVERRLQVSFDEERLAIIVRAEVQRAMAMHQEKAHEVGPFRIHIADHMASF